MDSLLTSDPSNIDGYVIEGRLGSGGFGIVYAATSPDGRPVAVKVLRPELSDDPRLRERLAREADALSRVEGERTAEIFEVVTEGDLVYLVMERVEGESLTDQVNDGGALSGPMLWFAATGLVQALQEIHAAGIVHRDLKPSNVMYGPDGVKVLDFGISVVADETSLTQTGAFVGTGAWMAPEMVLGNDITEKTDVYALGLVLAFIALGAHPFGEGRADALMYRILNSDPDLDGIPAPFIDAVSMCLQRDPGDRPTLDELGRFFGSNGEQQLSATSIVGSDTGGTRIVQSAAAAASSGGNRKRNALIGSGVAVVLAVVGVIVGVIVAGGDDLSDIPPELAGVEDTQLETDEVAFIQDDERETELVEPGEEPVVEEPVAAEEPVTEETEEPVVEEETVVEEQPTEDTEAALIALLTDTYSWGTASASKTMMLQEALGLTTDGSYGSGTRQVHLNALQERGLTITNVPDQPIVTPATDCSVSLTTPVNSLPWRTGGDVGITVTLINHDGQDWLDSRLNFEMLSIGYAAGHELDEYDLNFGSSSQATMYYPFDPIESNTFEVYGGQASFFGSNENSTVSCYLDIPPPSWNSIPGWIPPGPDHFNCSIQGLPDFASFDWTVPNSGSYSNWQVVFDGWGNYTYEATGAIYVFEIERAGIPPDQSIFPSFEGNVWTFPAYDWGPSIPVASGEVVEWLVYFETTGDFPRSCIVRDSVVVP